MSIESWEERTICPSAAHKIHQAIVDLVMENWLFPLFTYCTPCLDDLVSVFAISILSFLFFFAIVVFFSFVFHSIIHLFIFIVSPFPCLRSVLVLACWCYSGKTLPSFVKSILSPKAVSLLPLVDCVVLPTIFDETFNPAAVLVDADILVEFQDTCLFEAWSETVTGNQIE